MNNEIHETNPLDRPYVHPNPNNQVYWTEPGLYITRLRLLTDNGFPFWDVSYCHGTVDGIPCVVDLPFDQLPRRGMRRAIVEAAERDGIHARGIGILDNISTLS